MKFWLNLIFIMIWAWTQIMMGIRVTLDYSEKWWGVPMAALAILTGVLITCTYVEKLRQHIDKKSRK